MTRLALGRMVLGGLMVVAAGGQLARAAAGSDRPGMMPLGTKAPAFELTDVVSGKPVSIDDYDNQQALLVMFICRHCPYVKHVTDGLAKLGHDYAGKSVGIVAISANDYSKNAEDSPPKLKEMAEEKGFTFPLLFDESQQVAKAYTAVATPDFFVFGPDRTLVYRGQFDDSRPGNDKPVTGADVRQALDAVLAGAPVPADQHASFGCSIKWKPENAPSYAD